MKQIILLLMTVVSASSATLDESDIDKCMEKYQKQISVAQDLVKIAASDKATALDQDTWERSNILERMALEKISDLERMKLECH